MGLDRTSQRFEACAGTAAVQVAMKTCCSYYMTRRSNLREKVEERIDALPQLRLNLFARAFEQVHGDTGLVAVLKLDGCFTHPCHFLRGKQTQTIYKSQIRHSYILSLRA
jgi:hypothetical protein